MDSLNQFLRQKLFIIINTVLQALFAVQLIVFVCSFGHAVRVQKKHVAGFKRNTVIPIDCFLHCSKHQASPVPFIIQISQRFSVF